MADAVDRTVLVIHDLPLVLDAIGGALRDAGYAVAVARSSPAAIRDLRDVAPHVVVCREQMPLLGGRQLLRALASIDADLPVVVASESRDPHVTIEMMRNGALDCVAKPASSIGAVLAAVERGMHLAERRRSARRTAQELSEAQGRMARMLEQQAVIRSRAFAKIEAPLDRIATVLGELAGAGLEAEHAESIEAARADLLDVLELVASANTDSGRTSTNATNLETFHPADLGEFVRDAVLREAHERGVEFAAFVPVELPALRGDPQQLGSILVDLVRFLVRRFRGGVVHMELSIESRGRGPWVIRADVTDSSTSRVEGEDVLGLHLPGDDVVNVREELIDLSLTARAVSVLGGQLQMFEQRGVGTRFSFDVGLLKAKGKNGELPDPGLAASSVLLVEPCAPVCRATANELRRLGMRVATASSGEQAVNMLLRGVPPVLFVSLAAPSREILEAHLAEFPVEDRPELVYLSMAGEFAPAGVDALQLMRPPKRSVLIGVLERYVGIAESPS